ncbi:MAG: restriction endonuclease subunit S [Pseudomonas sp.]|uniref:restriction endonuclease subunit S n=1 Tax=Pseudomonas sp. TaxID=306 RepID=UPI001A32B046|nr:restriction endonuclease subunit S [Pseudomonas sp.]MBJ7372576.1 restriction endonuclease subunit S [Pseudomonas sp.]
MSSKTKTTGAMDDSTPPLVPKLRFPEFRGGDAWEPTTIGALGRFYYGKSAPKWSLTEDAPTPCVRYGELYTKFGPVISETYSRTNTDPKTLRFSKGGEILIPRVGEKPEDFGKSCAYLPLKGIAIGEMISVLETKQNPLFYTYYFRKLYKEFAKVVEGQNVKNLYFTELEPLPIHLPTLPEQKKIAECLSSVDDLIAAQARKVNALKSYKTGLMQQLFPREGETQPRLRFPEFQEAGKWEIKRLSEVIDLISGTHLSPGDYSSEGEIPYFTGPSDFTNDLANVTKWTKRTASVSQTEDTLITVKGSGVGEIWYSTLPEVAMGRQLMAVRSKSGSSRFMFQLLLTKRSRFEDLGSGNLIPGLSRVVILELEACFPKQPEQQRIADCLTTLDDLIAAKTQRYEALKRHKRALMQQLFPSSEEVEK